MDRGSTEIDHGRQQESQMLSAVVSEGVYAGSQRKETGGPDVPARAISECPETVDREKLHSSSVVGGERSGLDCSETLSGRSDVRILLRICCVPTKTNKSQQEQGSQNLQRPTPHNPERRSGSTQPPTQQKRRHAHKQPRTDEAPQAAQNGKRAHEKQMWDVEKAGIALPSEASSGGVKASQSSEPVSVEHHES